MVQGELEVSEKGWRGRPERYLTVAYLGRVGILVSDAKGEYFGTGLGEI